MLEYLSNAGILIHVGQNAKENDQISGNADPEHWWFHASGCPGAHVVARAPVVDRETKRDAAILAVYYSKACAHVKMVPVDMCQVESVSKEQNTNHGLVTVQDVVTLTVFPHKATEKARLGRLLTSV
jgi:predicted ribosome quality control (RQC) complex YloA/Tae2 family protein